VEQFVINGNNIDLLRNYPDNYFDAIVTDPPYGLGKEPNAEDVMKGWIEKGYHEIGGSGFMGKEWDAFIPQPIFWKEVFRVLKHGGHVVSFFGTRTYDWGVMAMRFAGFEVRDCIQWLYGSGFPKSYNVGKGIEGKIMLGDSNPSKFKNLQGKVSEQVLGFANSDFSSGHKIKVYDKTKIEVDYQSPQGKQWEGWGSALKPANEPIVLARKPLEKGLSIAENVLKWGTGGINIDGCRIRLSKGDDSRLGGNGTWKTVKMAENVYEGGYEGKDISSSNLGRFPANLILTHHPECECKGFKKVKGFNFNRNFDDFEGKEIANDIYGKGYKREIPKIPLDENGEETIEDWDCHPDCPIRIMDEQSIAMGIHSSGNKREKNVKSEYESTSYHAPKERQMNRFGDSGGASRFFYCAKASKSERNKGLEGFEEVNYAAGNQAKAELKRGNTDFNANEGKERDERNNYNQVGRNQNFHPTVKPVKLMQYLVKLITPPNGKVLDPFCGSGTTGIACKLEGFEFIGLEQDAEYSKIAQSRIDNYEEEIEEIVYITNKEGEKVQITQTSLF